MHPKKLEYIEINYFGDQIRNYGCYFLLNVLLFILWRVGDIALNFVILKETVNQSRSPK